PEAEPVRTAAAAPEPAANIEVRSPPRRLNGGRCCGALVPVSCVVYWWRLRFTLPSSNRCNSK
ncbi:hypothetical protein, partial [Yersinia pestis]